MSSSIWIHLVDSQCAEAHTCLAFATNAHRRTAKVTVKDRRFGMDNSPVQLFGLLWTSNPTPFWCHDVSPKHIYAVSTICRPGKGLSTVADAQHWQRTLVTLRAVPTMGTLTALTTTVVALARARRRAEATKVLQEMRFGAVEVDRVAQGQWPKIQRFGGPGAGGQPFFGDGVLCDSPFK